MICYGVGGGGGGVAVKDGTPSRSLRSRARQPHKALHAKALGEAKCGLRGVVAIAAIGEGEMARLAALAAVTLAV